MKKLFPDIISNFKILKGFILEFKVADLEENFIEKAEETIK